MKRLIHQPIVLRKFILCLGRFGSRPTAVTLDNQQQQLFIEVGMLLLLALSFKDIVMYSISDFRVMPFHKKCDLITFNGTYIAQRKLADCKVFLYDTGPFFAEVFYSPKYQKVLMINAFDKVIGLEPYLEEISLADLSSKTCM